MLFPDLFLVLFFWLHHAACRILVPHPGIKPKPSVVKLWSPNHQTSRKFSGSISCDWFYFLSCFLPFLIFYCKLNIMGPSVFRFLLSFWVRPIVEVFKTAFFVFVLLLFMATPCGLRMQYLNSQTRDQTCAPAFFNHWTSREVPSIAL